MKKRSIFRVFLLAALSGGGVVLSLISPPAVATAKVFQEPPTLAQGASSSSSVERAVEFIRKEGNEAINALARSDTGDSAKTATFHTILAENFDLQKISRSVLGPYWKKATPDQRDRFTRAYQRMLEKIYESKFQEYIGVTLQVKGANAQGNNVFLVASTLKKPGSSKPIDVEWRVMATGATFKIIDVKLEGLSIFATHRDEYRSILASNGGDIDSLIQALEEKAR